MTAPWPLQGVLRAGAAAAWLTARPMPPAPCTPALPPELWATILQALPLPDRLEAAPTCRLFARLVRESVRGVVVQLPQPTRAGVPSRLLADAAPRTVALLSPGACACADGPAAAATLAVCWDPHEQQLWQEAGSRCKWRPSRAAWHLRRVVAEWAQAAQRPHRPRSHTLVLAAPELDAPASEVQRLLAAAGAEAAFAGVSVPWGLLRLDGALAASLRRCCVRAAALPAALQVRLHSPPPVCAPEGPASTAAAASREGAASALPARARPARVSAP